MLNEMFNLIEEIDAIGNDLNKIKAELRKKDFDLKILKTEMEFGEDYTEFRDGLKVKEIAPKILKATEEECEEILILKEKRDKLEHRLTVLKLQFQYLKEVIDNK